MSGPIGAESVSLLLRLLPSHVAQDVLSWLDAAEAAKLRSILETAHSHSLSPEEQDRLLRDFFDMQRIAERPAPPSTNHAEPSPPKPKPAEPAAGDSDSDPVARLRRIDAALLTRALDEEQPVTAALILGKLSAEAASAVLQRMAPAKRSEVAIRLSKPNNPNPEIIDRLARAIVDKAAKLAEIPTEPTPEEHFRSLAAVFRRLGRAERVEVLKSIEQVDPQTVAAIRQELFQFEDLLLLQDRQMQELLVEIDLKTLSLALKGAPDNIKEKISKNMSSRNRQLLDDEITLLGSVPRSATAESRAKIVEILRRREEEGKLTLDAE